MPRRSRSAAPTTDNPPEYEEGRHLPISVGQTCDPLPPFVPHAPVHWRGKDSPSTGLTRNEKIAVAVLIIGLIIRFRSYFDFSFSLNKLGTSLAVIGAVVALTGPTLLRAAKKGPLGGSSKHFVDAKKVFNFTLLNGNYDRDEAALSKLITTSQTDVSDLRSMQYPKELIDFGALALAQAQIAAAEGAVPAPVAVLAPVAEATSGEDSDEEEDEHRRGRRNARRGAPAASPARSAAAGSGSDAEPASTDAPARPRGSKGSTKGSKGKKSGSKSSAAAVVTEDADTETTLADIGNALAQAIRSSQAVFAVPTALGPGFEALPSGKPVPILGAVRPDFSEKGFAGPAFTATMTETTRRTDGPWKVAREELNTHLADMYKLQLGTLPIDCHPVQLARLWDVALRPPRVLLFEWQGDMMASGTDLLAKFVDFAIKTCVPGRDEVLLVLESGGGGVAHYGHAAAVLARLRAHGVRLTVCVDMVAASGGYMMACVADRIVAAPFSFVGSIGVIAQIPNIHKVLKKNDVDMYQITAGRFKRTVTLLGHVTREDEKKLQGELEVIHRAFTDHIGLYRPSLAPTLGDIATGEVWLGRDALRLGLIDAIGISSEVIQQATRGALVIKVTRASSHSSMIMKALFGDDAEQSAATRGGFVGKAASAVADAIAPHLTAAVVAAMGAGAAGAAVGAVGAGAGAGAMSAATAAAGPVGAVASGESAVMRAQVCLPQGSVANLAQFA